MTDAGLTHYDPSIAVSVIVVNWNGRDHLAVCLESLRRQTLPGIEIIVVDNGSTDGSVAFLRDHFGTAVRVVEHATNLGYGLGLNAGIRAARGQYLFALNNDTEVAPDCLQRLVEAADEHPNVGSCAPKILSFSDRRRLDNVGHLIYPDGLSRGRGRLEEDRGQYDAEAELVGPSGCAVLLRRATLADVGLFDEDLFAYCEDTDLALRTLWAGWHCRAIPSAVVYHKYSASTTDYSPLKAFLVERNRVWVAAKCLPLPLLLTSPLFTAMRLGTQAWGALSQRGAAGRFAAQYSPLALLKVLLRAWLAGLAGLPSVWRKRRAVQRTRRLSAVDCSLFLWRHRMGVQEVALKE